MSSASSSRRSAAVLAVPSQSSAWPPVPNSPPARYLDRSFPVYGVITLFGLLFVMPAIDVYFGNTRSAYLPDRIGLGIVVVGAVTAVAWLMRLDTGRLEPPPMVRTAGRIALVAAVVIGFAHLVPEIGRIIPPE